MLSRREEVEALFLALWNVLVDSPRFTALCASIRHSGPAIYVSVATRLLSFGEEGELVIMPGGFYLAKEGYPGYSMTILTQHLFARGFAKYLPNIAPSDVEAAVFSLCDMHTNVRALQKRAAVKDVSRAA